MIILHISRVNAIRFLSGEIGMFPSNRSKICTMNGADKGFVHPHQSENQC